MSKWLSPVKGKRYRVVRESQKGRIGLCTDTRESDFGMKWAYLVYEEEKMDNPNEEWVRTAMLEEIEE